MHADSISVSRFYILQFLNFLQAQLRLLKKLDYFSSTITVMLVGIPNVGKSAIVNSLHKIGRISAAGTQTILTGFHPSTLHYEFLLNCWFFIEKGKLKHATVSPQPCETKDIRSFKVCTLMASSPLQCFLFCMHIHALFYRFSEKNSSMQIYIII